jgi:hypothetical protein
MYVTSVDSYDGEYPGGILTTSASSSPGAILIPLSLCCRIVGEVIPIGGPEEGDKGLRTGLNVKRWLLASVMLGEVRLTDQCGGLSG